MWEEEQTWAWAWKSRLRHRLLLLLNRPKRSCRFEILDHNDVVVERRATVTCSYFRCKYHHHHHHHHHHAAFHESPALMSHQPSQVVLYSSSHCTVITPSDAPCSTQIFHFYCSRLALHCTVLNDTCLHFRLNSSFLRRHIHQSPLAPPCTASNHTLSHAPLHFRLGISFSLLSLRHHRCLARAATRRRPRRRTAPRGT